MKNEKLRDQAEIDRLTKLVQKLYKIIEAKDAIIESQVRSFNLAQEKKQSSGCLINE